MRHRRKVKQLSMEKSRREAVLRNQAKDLILHGKVDTTPARARATQQVVERLVAWAKKGNQAARRMAFAVLQDKEATTKLFEEIAPRYKDRPGGYTRVLKLGPRRGDGAEMARLMWV